MCGVYKITSPSGKIYIGSSVNIKRRFNKYRALNCKAQVRLYNSFLKYGVENHIFEIIFECDKNIIRQKEFEFGQEYNVLSDNGLNCRIPKYNDLVLCVSEETRKRMSEAHLGQRPTNLEQLRIINTGRRQTEETKEKLRKINTGHKYNKHLIGKQKDADFCKKVSDGKKKPVINIVTNERYKSAEEASKTLGISTRYLRDMLCGYRKNRTNFQYEQDICIN